MTSDPNDVDAWLNEFAPEVDALGSPSPTEPVAAPSDPFLDAVRAEAPAPSVDSVPGATQTFSSPAPASYESSAAAAGGAGGGLIPPAGGIATSTFDVDPDEDAAWSEDFERATGGVPVVNADGQDPDGLEGEWSEDESGSRFDVIFEWAPILIGAVIVAALVRTFVFQAFYIPSPSMTPTLEIDDRVLVNKLSYDFNDVGWGDIVVFKRPANLPGDVEDLIKRVMALPGDRIEFFNGDVYVNNIRVQETYVAVQGVTDSLTGSESIPGCVDATSSACTVPEGFVFVLGDNRNGSQDSRVFGPVPIDDIVGRAMVRVWPLTELSLF